MSATLSAYVRANPRCIDSSLQKLSCTSKQIRDIDIYPSVLSALTNTAAPPDVQEMVKDYLLVPRPSPSSSGATIKPLRNDASLHLSPFQGAKPSSAVAKPTGTNREDEENGFNVGIAMTLHTVLLSRNHISRLLGIVQFKYCVRLSLLGNRIRRIEDCEPLALLVHLQFLSLEFNPVTHLPHYRPHMLRICSWPEPLSANYCRLKKLDASSVTLVEIKHAVMCLQREAGLLPELLQRMQLLAFVKDIEQRQQLHREMQRRGSIHQQAREPTTLHRILERCAPHILSYEERRDAAHRARLAVLEQSRHQRSAPFPKNRSKTPEPLPSTMEEDDGEESEQLEVSTATYETSNESSSIKTALLSSVSAVSCCTSDTSNPAASAEVVQALSTMMATTDLSWSLVSLRKAGDAAPDPRNTCKEWSMSAFRRTIVSLDVRLCSYFLRASHTLGQTLTSRDVDDLCQVWLHALSHYRTVEMRGVNVTGPRRLPTLIKPNPQQRQSYGVTPKRPAARVEEPQPVAAIEKKPTAVPEKIEKKEEVLHRLPVEAFASTCVDVLVVSDANGCLSDLSESCSSASLPSRCSTAQSHLSEESPRSSLPQPSGAPAKPPSSLPFNPLLSQCPVSLVSNDSHRGTEEPLCSSSGGLPTRDKELNATAETLELIVQRRKRREVLQQWRVALVHRWQERLCKEVILDKLSVGFASPARHYHVHPSCSGLLAHLPYGERKRVFFQRWRTASADLSRTRVFRLRQILHAWRCRVKCLTRIRAVGNSHIALQKRAVFHTWKKRAEQSVERRCEAALARLSSSAVTPLHHRAASLALEVQPLSTVSPALLMDVLNPTQGGPPSVWRSPTVMAIPGDNGSRRTPSAGHLACAHVNNLTHTKASSCTEAGLSSNTSPSPYHSVPPSGATPCSWRRLQFTSPPEAPVGLLEEGSKARAFELSPPPPMRSLFPQELLDTCQKSRYWSHSLSQPHPSFRSTGAVIQASSRVLKEACNGKDVACGNASVEKKCSAVDRSLHPSPPCCNDCHDDHCSIRCSPVLPPAEASCSPYPAADVEALVGRAGCLEAERNQLVREVAFLQGSLIERGALQRPAASSSNDAVQLPRCDASNADDVEQYCARQAQEISRLKDCVVALREERRGFLKRWASSANRALL